MRWYLAPAITVSSLLGVASSVAAQQADGQAVYRQECKSCHGVNGTPPARAREQYKKIKALGDGGFVADLTVDSIVVILKKGLSKDMKSFAGKLSEPEIKAVATYIKELAVRKAAP